MEKKWKLRDCIESDRKKLFDWRNMIDKRIITEDFFKWQYFDNPSGPVDTWVADDGGKIVGQYTIQRQEYFYYGKKVIGSLAFDLATHPDYRYQGMFTTLGFHSLKEAGKRNISFTLGYPWVKGIAIPGHKKVGWTLLGELKIYELKNLDVHEGEQINGFSIKEVNLFDDKYDVLALEHKNDAFVMLNRTGAYLNWRYMCKKGYKYYCFEIVDTENRLVGFFILKIYEDQDLKILHIIDFILPKNKKLYQKVLNFAVVFASEQKANIITLVINKNLEFFNFLKSKGFKHQQRFFIPIVHVNNENVDIIKMNNIHDYYFTMGDNDIF
jgi:predicted acetyltransferase